MKNYFLNTRRQRQHSLNRWQHTQQTSEPAAVTGPRVPSLLTPYARVERSHLCVAVAAMNMHPNHPCLHDTAHTPHNRTCARIKKYSLMKRRTRKKNEGWSLRVRVCVFVSGGSLTLLAIGSCANPARLNRRCVYDLM